MEIINGLKAGPYLRKYPVSSTPLFDLFFNLFLFEYFYQKPSLEIIRERFLAFGYLRLKYDQLWLDALSSFVGQSRESLIGFLRSIEVNEYERQFQQSLKEFTHLIHSGCSPWVNETLHPKEIHFQQFEKKGDQCRSYISILMNLTQGYPFFSLEGNYCRYKSIEPLSQMPHLMDICRKMCLSDFRVRIIEYITDYLLHTHQPTFEFTTRISTVKEAIIRELALTPELLQESSNWAIFIIESKYRNENGQPFEKGSIRKALYRLKKSNM